MTDPPPITQTGTTVLIQGAALALMYRATLTLIACRHRDGWPHDDLAAPRTWYGSTSRSVPGRSVSRRLPRGTGESEAALADARSCKTTFC